MKAIRHRSIMQRLRDYKRHPFSFLMYLAILLASVLSAGIISYLVGYILVKGTPHLSWDLFAWQYNSQNVSLMPAAINTLTMTLASLLIAVPVSLGTAIYLVEYAPKRSKAVQLVRLAAETLSGIPSIVYGLFGMLFFVIQLRWGYSLLAGAFTLSIMILPLVMRTAEEALIAVPDGYREGAFALGAGRLRTVFAVVLPAAIPGILSGVILAIGRVVGESAALIFTAGTVAGVPSSLMRSGRTLAVHMYALSNEGLYIDQTYATAIILLVLIIGINALAARAAKRLGGNRSI